MTGSKNKGEREKALETITPRSRKNPKRAISRNLILENAERLMLEEGYAAVSSRRVAKEAGLKAPLVHYYFPTTDDLFVAVYRRAVERELEKQRDALETPTSLRGVWDAYCNQEQTALAMEFMALANHRKTLRDEIVVLTEQIRRRRAEVLAKMIDIKDLDEEEFSAAGLSVLLIGVARTLVMEKGLGISLGHAEARRFVERWLEELEKTSS